MSSIPATDAPPTVPFMDLRPQTEEIRGDLELAIREILDGSGFIGGPYLDRFEAAFASFVGTGHAVGVASGTDAVRIALHAVGVRPGETVVTVSHTFIATAEAVTQAGATPVFVDIEPEAQTLSPAALA
ncbi:MAG: DegT/DnrJ/EryC1/StrS family aminotransferase, partial [Gemmatimonadota bacterium]